MSRPRVRVMDIFEWAVGNTRVHAGLLLAAVVLVLPTLGCAALGPPTSEPTAVPTPTGASVTMVVTAAPSMTPVSPEHRPSMTPTSDATSTSPPTRELSPTPEAAAERPTATPRPPTETPTHTPKPPLHSPTVVSVIDTRVVYHDGFSQAGFGVYEHGTLPWLDLLVQLGGTWYGPEREAGDDVNAVPLPDGYRWETEGGFGCLWNGEAWWKESGTEGVARLIGPDDRQLVEVPLQVTFRGPVSGREDTGPGVSPTPEPLTSTPEAPSPTPT